MAFTEPYRAKLLAARCAAVASIGAAAIHLGVTPVHWQDWAPSGVFFGALAIFQVAWGFLAWLRPTGPLLALGVLINAAAIALWVTSRTSGAPLGPHAGLPEPVDAAGICALLLQSYVVMGALWAWSRCDADYVSGWGGGLILLGANAIMAGAVMMGLASSLQGHGHHHDAGATDHGAPSRPAERTAPPGGAGLPVVDMGLETGDHDHDHG